MAYNEKSVGNYGRWRITVDQTSQSKSNNSSVVRVRGTLYNDGTIRAFNNNSLSRSISGQNSWSGSGSFSVNANSSQTVIDQSFTVKHDSAGNKTVSYTVTHGNTGTTTFGNPGSVSVSLKLTKINVTTVPGKTPTPSIAFTAPLGLKVSWSAAANGGAAITDYQIQYATNSSFSGAGSALLGTARTYSRNGALGTTAYFRVRARNSNGYGPWSSTASRVVPNVPSTPAAPSLSFGPPSSITASWVAPANNGAGIIEYQLQYADNTSFTGAGSVTQTGRSRTVTGTTQGKTWSFRVRARNSQGWSAWSGRSSYAVANPPAAPGSPKLTFSPPTSLAFSWSAPNNGGATITAYEMQYDDNSNFTSAVTFNNGTSLSRSTAGLTPGKTWYFRVRAKNSQGNSPWSTVVSYFITGGPRVLVGGVYRNTIAYVRVNGVWRVAVPYVRVNGTYRVAGG